MTRADQQARPAVCAVCGSDAVKTGINVKAHNVYSCPRCGLQFLHPQPDDEELERIYTADYFLHERTVEGERRMAALKSATAQVYLDELIKAGAVRGTTLLEIGCGTGDFLLAAQSAGFHVSGIEISGPAAATANARLGRPCVTTGTLDTVTVPPGSVDTVAFFDVVEHVRQPVDFLSRVHKALKPGGRVILVTPSLDSWSAKLLGSHWMEYKPEHLFYFGERSLGRLFSAAGFGAVLFRPNRKVLSADYVNRHFERFRVPLFSPVMGAVRSVLPATLAHRQFQVVASGVMVLAQKPAEG